MGVMDANSAGYVHGGAVMRYADEAAGLAATRHSGCRVVTAAMDRMTFNEPVHVGEVVTFKATVNAAWRTSMEVGVRVEAENIHTGEVMHTSTAYLTMVALTPEGKPAAVPPVDPQTEDEHRRLREAEHRRATRLREREEIVAARSSESTG
jgi:acyl-CoA hydrolase